MARNEQFKISFERLGQLISAMPWGNRGGLKKDILKTLGKAQDEKRFNQEIVREKKTGRYTEVSESTAKELARPFGMEGSFRPFIKSLRPVKMRETPLFPAERGHAEIFVLSAGDNLLNASHYPVDALFSVFVDHVEFRQRDKDSSEVEVRRGRYIRIQPVAERSDGAITLTLDRVRPRVLLVSQYRHNTFGYMTEAVRGLPDPDDESEDHTGMRELLEESGYIPARVSGETNWIALKSTYTDSGKFTEAPGYFLAFVDANQESAKRNKQEPEMEDPVWVDLYQFYRAIFKRGPVELDKEKDEFEFVLHKEFRDKLNTRAKINNGLLEINDSYTIVAAFLALPILVNRYSLDLRRILEV